MAGIDDAYVALDLPGGTRALSHSVLRGLPKAQVELLDIDPQMLLQARTRLAPFGERVRFTEASFGSVLPKSIIHRHRIDT